MKPIHVPAGTRFHDLTVIEEVEPIRYGAARQSFRAFSCRCTCGSLVAVTLSALKRGNTRSCGCLAQKIYAAKRNPVAAGDRFGRLEVVEEVAGVSRRRRLTCRCQCGTIRAFDLTELRRGATRSCGCLQRERAAISNQTHGLSKHPLFRIWTGMHRRCRNVNDSHYGGKGVYVCARWSGSEGFPNFLADMGERPEAPEDSARARRTYSIDRIDNDGPYSPDNCRWATQSEQMFNQG